MAKKKSGKDASKTAAKAAKKAKAAQKVERKVQKKSNKSKEEEDDDQDLEGILEKVSNANLHAPLVSWNRWNDISRISRSEENGRRLIKSQKNWSKDHQAGGRMLP